MGQIVLAGFLRAEYDSIVFHLKCHHQQKDQSKHTHQPCQEIQQKTNIRTLCMCISAETSINELTSPSHGSIRKTPLDDANSPQSQALNWVTFQDSCSTSI